MLSCEKCGNVAHRDDAYERRCNGCERLVRLCICESSDIPDKVVLYTMSIRNAITHDKRTIYGHVTPNVIDQYWKAYAEVLKEDEELVIERWNSNIPVQS